MKLLQWMMMHKHQFGATTVIGTHTHATTVIHTILGTVYSKDTLSILSPLKSAWLVKLQPTFMPI